MWQKADDQFIFYVISTVTSCRSSRQIACDQCTARYIWPSKQIKSNNCGGLFFWWPAGISHSESMYKRFNEIRLLIEQSYNLPTLLTLHIISALANQKHITVIMVSPVRFVDHEKVAIGASNWLSDGCKRVIYYYATTLLALISHPNLQSIVQDCHSYSTSPNHAAKTPYYSLSLLFEDTSRVQRSTKFDQKSAIQIKTPSYVWYKHSLAVRLPFDRFCSSSIHHLNILSASNPHRTEDFKN